MFNQIRIFRNMLPHGSSKTYRVVFEEKEKQKKRREQDSEDPLTAAVAYVDTARKISNNRRFFVSKMF